MTTTEFWCVWDPAKQEEHLFSTLDAAMKYVRRLCDEDLETGDQVRIEHRTVVFED